MTKTRVQRGLFERRNTVSYPAFPSDVMIHARPDGLGQPQEHGILDFWFFHGGEKITITDQSKDFPCGFELHPSEVEDDLRAEDIGRRLNAPVIAPNYWRLRTGDHLLIAGERPDFPGGVTIFDFIFQPCALACWRQPDGAQPFSEELAAVPRPYENNPIAIERMQHAVQAFLKSPPSREISHDWLISS